MVRRMSALATIDSDCDIVVVGAGIVGLSCAWEAARRGLSVTVCERDDRAVGASVRNFGHGFISAQAGPAFEAALLSGERWLALAQDAGFWAAPTGTVLVARAADELQVCAEFAAGDPRRRAHVLTAAEVAEHVPLRADAIAGGLLCAGDIRVDQRAAPAAIAAWLQREFDVRVHWRTAVHGVAATTVQTAAGPITARAVVVCPGHDLDCIYPDVFAGHEVGRVLLQMLSVDAPDGCVIEPALVTGLSLLRYAGFAGCPSLAAVRERLERERPELLAAGIHLVITQRPSGELVIGDSHAYERTPAPFGHERIDELLLAEAAELLGVPTLRVRERWQGVYAHAPGQDFLVAAPAPAVRVVAVTSGIGMTTALGLASGVLDELTAEIDHTYEEAST